MIPSKTPANRLRILIVDDIPQVLEDLGILLSWIPPMKSWEKSAADRKRSGWR